MHHAHARRLYSDYSQTLGPWRDAGSRRYRRRRRLTSRRHRGRPAAAQPAPDEKELPAFRSARFARSAACAKSESGDPRLLPLPSRGEAAGGLVDDGRPNAAPPLGSFGPPAPPSSDRTDRTSDPSPTILSMMSSIEEWPSHHLAATCASVATGARVTMCATMRATVCVATV